MDVGISAHSSDTQAHNKEHASNDLIAEQNTFNRMVIDPDTALTELAIDPDVIDLTLSD